MDFSGLAAVVTGLILVWVLLVGLLWLLRPRGTSLRALVAVVPDVLRLGRQLVADPTIPRGVRLALVGLVVWLVSPIDLVPEFIPILGPVDDVVVAVLVLRYVRRRLGEPELRRRWPGSVEGYELLGGVLR